MFFRFYQFGIGIAVSLLIGIQGVMGAFSDVPENHIYAPDIKFLEDQGILAGQVFGPDAKITRGEFAVWLMKSAGFKDDKYKGKARILDVKKKSPEAAYIAKLVDLGAAELKQKNKFQPQKTIAKKEALEWIFEVYGVPVPKIFEEAQFQAADVPVNSAVAPLINKALLLGIMYPGEVGPNSKLERGEAAHYIKTASQAGGTVTITILNGADSDLSKNPKYDILVGAWNKIFQDYLRKSDLKKEDMVYGAIEGMVKELGDKHSDFERPGDNALLDSLAGQIEGIGAVLQMKDDEAVIVSPILGSPAAKSGLLPNDVVTAVDGESVRGLKLSEVVAKIRGPKGTEVKLSIRRNGKTLEFTVVRDVVKVVSVALEWTDDNVAKVQINDFGINVAEEFAKIAKEIVEKKARGIILDVRNNPGGYLDKAIDLGGHFVKEGQPVAVLRYPDHEKTHPSKGEAELTAFKTVILTNAGSASASEIFAGALQDYGIAKVIGEKSFGKGTVQELSDFPDGSTLKITVAEWLTPKKRTIEHNGVMPDIEVKLTEADRKEGKDPQMVRALEEVRK